MSIDAIYHYSMAIVTVVIGIIMLSDTKYNSKNFILKVIVPMAMLVTFTIVWTNYYMEIGLPTVGRLSVVISLGLYALFFSKYGMYAKVIIISVYYTSNILMRDISYLIVYGFDMPLNNDPIYDLTKFLIFTAVLVISGIYIKRYKINKTEVVSRTFWFIIIFVITCYWICRVIMDILFEMDILSAVNSRYFERVVLGLIIIILNLLLYYILYNLNNYYSHKEELTILKQKQSEIMDDVLKTNQLHNEMRIMRHELKNNFLIIQGLLKTQEYDKLKKYVADYLKTEGKALNHIDCGNKVMNNILNYKQEDLIDQGIAFSTMVSVPEQLPFKDIDITSLLVNLIENAAEASLKTPEPSVFLNINTEKGYCFITIINPVHNDVLSSNPSLETTKDDKANHGLGLKIIHNIVEKYDGYINFEQKQGDFIVSVMLSIS